jgi:hypothetical protein
MPTGSALRDELPHDIGTLRYLQLHPFIQRINSEHDECPRGAGQSRPFQRGGTTGFLQLTEGGPVL